MCGGWQSDMVWRERWRAVASTVVAARDGSGALGGEGRDARGGGREGLMQVY